MLLFPLYAGIMWLLAAKWRREWKGFAVVLGGTLFMLFIEYTLYKLGALNIGSIDPGGALGLLVPFTVFVSAVGLFIACQPRSAPSEVHCKTCFYDLTGLDPVELTCPECGGAWRGRGSGYAVSDEARVPRYVAETTGTGTNDEARESSDKAAAEGAGIDTK
ncbi:MAG: hypothetical protein H7210_00165 [Pyrinomonadaceae bacterium]|nr:hypothetical protein [Phycisphaerales bacterium]